MKDIYLQALTGFDHLVDTAADTDHSLRNTFKSFWMGGYECSDQLNCFGNRVDLLAETRHLENIHEDYQRLQEFNIQTVREGIRWSKVETAPYQYDFSQVKLMIEAAAATGIQQVWDMCHFGYPDDLTPVHPQFTNRFVALCKAFLSFYREQVPVGQVIITPINEVGFISWLGGEVGGTSPYGVRMGWDVKYALTQAYIKGIEALKEMDKEVLIMVTEPLVNIVPPEFPTEHELQDALNQHEIQYQVVDMLTGRMCSELGGRPGLVDIIGLNYYYNNQWIVGTGHFLPWANEEDDPRWRSLASLLMEAQNRYQLPLVIAETSHPKEDRPLWITYIGKTCVDALEMGVNLQGICLYPIIDRPDWDHLTDWHQSGLWDSNIFDPNERHLYKPYAAALLLAQHRVATQLPGAVPAEAAVYKF
jgi:beta-glucosidase/6-phospho-beta-glucosidase/beta-galactosidase